MNGIILAVSNTLLSDQSAKVLGALLGSALAIWIIYIIVKAIQIQSKENKEKRVKKGKTHDSKAWKFIKKYVPLILVGIAIIAMLMIAD